jgi:hypothetical protein
MGIPVDRLLVPDVPPTAPAGAALVQQPLVRGLPATLQLDARLSLVVFAPTGIAQGWRDAEPGSVVATAQAETAPLAAAVDILARPPVRLVLLRAGVFAAAVPLVLGVHRIVPDDGSGAAQVELVLLDYALHAGTLCGSGDHGSFIRFAWRRLGASDTFAPPALPPRVAERFVSQVQSRLGDAAAEA